MKIFISWSGERSRQVAELLSTWIQCVLQAAKPWLSSKDIDRGSLWFSEITSQLSDTHNGIVCLTKSNLSKPWILFESGALAKGLSSNRVYTFLIDLESNDVKDPLAQFNHTTPNRQGLYQLIRTINKGLDNNQSLKEDILNNVFDTYWPQFEEKFKEVLSATNEEEINIERPQEDILSEILSSVRGMDKRLRKVEEVEYFSNSFSEKPKFEPFDTPIEELELSVRTFNILKARKVNYVKDILGSNFGEIALESPKAANEIKTVLNELGIFVRL